MSSLFLYPNLIDSVDTPPDFVGGGWLADSPITNIRDDGRNTGFFSYIAQSNTTSAADTQFELHFPTAVAAKGFVIPLSNLSQDAVVKVTAANDADFQSVMMTSIEPVFPIVFPIWSIPITAPEFITGKPSASGAQMPSIHVFDVAVFASHYRIEIVDEQNPDGHIWISRAFLGAGWSPSVNAEYGASLRLVNRAIRSESIAGARFYDRRRHRRQWVLNYKHLPSDEFWANMYELQTVNGIDGQFYFSLDPSDIKNRHRQSFLCTLEEPSELLVETYQTSGTTVLLSEVIA